MDGIPTPSPTPSPTVSSLFLFPGSAVSGVVELIEGLLVWVDSVEDRLVHSEYVEEELVPSEYTEKVVAEGDEDVEDDATLFLWKVLGLGEGSFRNWNVTVFPKDVSSNHR